MSNFKQLNLSAKILSSLDKKGYVNPTPIQIKSIPHLLQGKDLLGIAQTGTGKTAAFALPILDNLSKSKKQVTVGNVRSLILTPTRELATQIADNIELYGHGLGLRYTVIFGGISIHNQIKKMKKGFDIVVATPGRLLDLIKRGCVRFDNLEILVLDEADRMLDMGFIHDVKKIISKLPQTRQTLLFSATMPKDIAVLANSILTDPIKVEVTPQATTVEKIDQRVNMVDKGNKPSLLKEILKQEDAQSVLVFSKTKHGANRIVRYLNEASITVTAIHGNKSQSQREKALSEFRLGKVQVLVATDIAARGIDIPAISHVINYDIPHDPENYVHRIGRTARAGREGIAISFCDYSERKLLKEVEKVIKFKIPIDDTHPFHGVKVSSEAKDSFQRKKSSHNNHHSSREPASDTGYVKRKSNSDDSGFSEKKRERSKFSENRNKRFDKKRSEESDSPEDRRRKFNSEDKKRRLNSNKKTDNSRYSRKERARMDFAENRNKRFSEEKSQQPDSFEGKRFNSDKKTSKKFGSSKPFFADKNKKFGTKKNNGSGKNSFKADNHYNKNNKKKS